MKGRSRRDRTPLYFAGFAVLSLMFALSLPDPLFSSYYSPALYDRSGALLGAMAAFDGQWRFPASLAAIHSGGNDGDAGPGGGVNEKFAAAIVEAEDRRFFRHTGVDFFALGRAFIRNLRAGRVVSGGSTLTMQTIRLSRPGHKRGLFEKAVEAVLAMRLEISRSKGEILALYAANAPFGANVVGLEAAAWRWFGRPPADLSWAEAATLAVLPNAPGLIHPGRNREFLRQKRDGLLEKLRAKGLFDDETLALSRAEPLPGEPLPLPALAPHLLSRIVTEEGGLAAFNPANRNSPLFAEGWAIKTTLDRETQERAKTILDRWTARFAAQGINNGACLILDTASGRVLAYVGNVSAATDAPDVDIITSPRSSGSLLKPFLYAAMLDSGETLPASLVSDIPTRAGGYTPENSSRSYLGVVPADAALARSLNVPAVRSLRRYGVERFADLLRGLGLSTLFRRAEDYGLPLILGGAEVTLWEITGLYAGLARASNGANIHNGASPFFHPHYFMNEDTKDTDEDTPRAGNAPVQATLISPGAAWLTLEALTFVNRPGDEARWQEYAGSRRIAWKTGTSFGSRDGWAVGTRPDRTVGVWVGNASGEGRAELVSASTSAPVLFELFSALDSMGAGNGGEWFSQPAEELRSAEVCAFSGFPAGADCAAVKSAFAPRGAPEAVPCPYCRTVALNESGGHRVTVGAFSTEPVRLEKWFVLPPAEEWYYRRWNLDYRPLPPAEGAAPGGISSIALFNPEENGAVYAPRELSGREGRVVFQAAVRDGGVLYWHLDDVFLGATETFHEMEARPPPGRHALTLVDAAGNTLTRRFEVLSGAD